MDPPVRNGTRNGNPVIRSECDGPIEAVWDAGELLGTMCWGCGRLFDGDVGTHDPTFVPFSE